MAELDAQADAILLAIVGANPTALAPVHFAASGVDGDTRSLNITDEVDDGFRELDKAGIPNQFDSEEGSNPLLATTSQTDC